MSDKMPCYIENSDFFVFKDLSACLINKNTTLSQFVYLCNALQKGAFTNSVSFIRSKNKNMILENTLKVILEYWKFENKMHDYLLISYILTLVIFQNQTLKEQFINAKSSPTTLEYGMMQKCLFEHLDKKTYEEIKKLPRFIN